MTIQPSTNSFYVKPVEADDNAPLKNLILEILDKEFGYDRPGFASQDVSLSDMHQNYSSESSAYFVVKNEEGKLVGGAGVAQLKGTDTKICELQKMYLDPSVRNHGLGKRLMAECIEKAKALGYDHCYLETTEKMTDAHRLYYKSGFVKCERMGNTGHDGCDAFFIKDLSS